MPIENKKKRFDSPYRNRRYALKRYALKQNLPIDVSIPKETFCLFLPAATVHGLRQ